jgi:hypothetical protein
VIVASRLVLLAMAALPFVADRHAAIVWLVAAQAVIALLGSVGACCLNSWLHQLIPADRLAPVLRAARGHRGRQRRRQPAVDRRRDRRPVRVPASQRTTPRGACAASGTQDRRPGPGALKMRARSGAASQR